MAICTICGFETEFMKQHMTNHGDERKFQCDKCEKVVTGRKALENHKKSHMSWNCTNCEEVIPHNSRSMHIKRCKRVSNTLLSRHLLLFCLGCCIVVVFCWKVSEVPGCTMVSCDEVLTFCEGQICHGLHSKCL